MPPPSAWPARAREDANRMVARRINAERLVLLGWSRAILMQLAHPLIAAGVEQHSTFRGSASQAVRRLHHTVGAMLSLTFGDEPRRAGAIGKIRDIHRGVNGVLGEPVGRYSAETRYSAEDPALLLWVHATLLDSTVDIYQRVCGPLPAADLDTYCIEALDTLIDLGGDRATAPRTWASLTAYMRSVEESGTLATSASTRALADHVLSPRDAVWAAPVGIVNRLLTIGLLPPYIRAVYGYDWDTAREARFARAMQVIRRTRSVAPAWIAHWADAR